MIKKALVFISEAQDELKKVSWPEREEVARFTIVVLISVVLISAFLWMVDTMLMSLIKRVMY